MYFIQYNIHMTSKYVNMEVIKMDAVIKNYERLKEAKGMSDYRVAKQTGLSYQAVLNFKQGKSDIRLSTIRKIAAALGVSASELVD